ncbi:MAG: HlyC/CorC family transporter [Deltaproteobacteria bacterium]|nr:MAG: HlyC/CorC family transporter [Deltaproteobacteria bacterium]
MTVPNLLLLAAWTRRAAAQGTPEPVGLDAPVAHLDPAMAVGITVVLLLLSAFFSGSETALFSLQPIDRRALSPDGTGPVESLLRQPRRTLASLLIGNEFVNVLLSTVTAGVVFSVFPERPWINVVLLTPLLLLFGEVLPKTLALRLNRRVAPIVAPVLLWFSRVVTPLRWVLTQIAELFLVATGGGGLRQEAALQEDRLLRLLEEGRASGAVGQMEEEMIQKVFEFGDLTVSRLMTPRPDIFSLSLMTPWPELLDQVRRHGHSRVPIWQGNPDNIIGVLVVKDLLPHLAARLREAEDADADPRDLPLPPRQLQKVLRPAYFVPTSKRAEDMLAEFREQKFHMAIVVDEHGNVAGLVTLDDLLAELVGELLDEVDELTDEVTEVEEGVYTIRGHMDVDDFAERFGVTLPEGEYDTVAGFVLDLAGTVPEKGTELEWEGLTFTVRGLEGKRITELCVRIPQERTAAGDQGTAS